MRLHSRAVWQGKVTLPLWAVGLPLRAGITEPALRGPRPFGKEQAGGPTVTVNKTFHKALVTDTVWGWHRVDKQTREQARKFIWFWQKVTSQCLSERMVFSTHGAQSTSCPCGKSFTVTPTSHHTQKQFHTDCKSDWKVKQSFLKKTLEKAYPNGQQTKRKVLDFTNH